MKKLTISLIACLSFFQAIQAEMPALNSPVKFSLQHYETLVTTLSANPDFQDIIAQGEFITDIRIQRRSINVSEGNVYVSITTKLPAKILPATEEAIVSEPKEEAKSCGRRNGHRRNHRRSNMTKTYVATLLLTPQDNGTSTATVVSIEPVSRNCRTFIGKEGSQAADQTLDLEAAE